MIELAMSLLEIKLPPPGIKILLWFCLCALTQTELKVYNNLYHPMYTLSAFTVKEVSCQM